MDFISAKIVLQGAGRGSEQQKDNEEAEEKPPRRRGKGSEGQTELADCGSEQRLIHVKIWLTLVIRSFRFVPALRSRRLQLPCLRILCPGHFA